MEREITPELLERTLTHLPDPTYVALRLSAGGFDVDLSEIVKKASKVVPELEFRTHEDIESEDDDGCIGIGGDIHTSFSKMPKAVLLKIYQRSYGKDSLDYEVAHMDEASIFVENSTWDLPYEKTKIAIRRPRNRESRRLEIEYWDTMTERVLKIIKEFSGTYVPIKIIGNEHTYG